LSVRRWSCSDCGFAHDRDVNAARNPLFAAAGCAVEGYVYAERQQSPSLVGEHQFDVRINLATDLNGSSLAVGQTSRREP
jgi:hypothetical protein